MIGKTGVKADEGLVLFHFHSKYLLFYILYWIRLSKRPKHTELRCGVLCIMRLFLKPQKSESQPLNHKKQSGKQIPDKIGRCGNIEIYHAQNHTDEASQKKDPPSGNLFLFLLKRAEQTPNTLSLIHI